MGKSDLIYSSKNRSVLLTINCLHRYAQSTVFVNQFFARSWREIGYSREYQILESVFMENRFYYKIKLSWNSEWSFSTQRVLSHVPCRPLRIKKAHTQRVSEQTIKSVFAKILYGERYYMIFRFCKLTQHEIWDFCVDLSQLSFLYFTVNQTDMTYICKCIFFDNIEFSVSFIIFLFLFCFSES